MKAIAMVALCSVFSAGLFAQKTVNICGEYVYHAPENVSVEQAKKTALERAKLQALADKFGTTLSQHNLTVLKNENEKSDISLLSLGGSEVKGEWIDNAEPPTYTTAYEQDMLVVTAKVCGRAREILGAGVDFSAKVLRNGTEASFEAGEFLNGNDLYLLFRSPANGYLAVYLVDNAQTAFCLLPYMNDPKGKTPVEGGKEYVFFSKKHADPSEAAAVDEYTLTCEKAAEHNLLYVIFSPNEFTKALDRKQEETALPRELPFEDFQKWLAKNRGRDKDMKVEVKTLTIKK
jgi:hypothetical protein